MIARPRRKGKGRYKNKHQGKFDFEICVEKGRDFRSFKLEVERKKVTIEVTEKDGYQTLLHY